MGAVEEIEKQIVDKKAEKKKAMEENTQTLRTKKEFGDDQVKALSAMIDELKNAKAKSVGELNDLPTGKHAAHEEINSVKNAIQAVIDTREARIQNLTALVSRNEN